MACVTCAYVINCSFDYSKYGEVEIYLLNIQIFYIYTLLYYIIKLKLKCFYIKLLFLK